MPRIHSSSVVDPAAQLADDVEVGPLCHVGPRVTLGAGTRLVSHVCILGRTTLGAGNVIWPMATLGADPQDLKFRGEDAQLIIGDHNVIRENVTIHLGTENGGGITRVGDENLIMAGVHIAHDCIVGSHIVIANNTGLAGHVHIHDHANIAGAVGCHHFVTFGQYSFVGGMSRIVHDVPPFMIVEGNPSEIRGVNAVGLKRHGFDPDSVERLKDAYRRLFRKTAARRLGAEAQAADAPASGGGSGGEADSFGRRLEALVADYPDDECITILAQALRNSLIGTYGRYRESLRKDARHAPRG